LQGFIKSDESDVEAIHDESQSAIEKAIGGH
jgi:hypothetical protein